MQGSCTLLFVAGAFVVKAHEMGSEAAEGNKASCWRIFLSCLGSFILSWTDNTHSQSHSCISNLINHSVSVIHEDHTYEMERLEVEKSFGTLLT